MLWSNLKIHHNKSDKRFFQKYYYKLEIGLSLAPILRDRKNNLTRQVVADFSSKWMRVDYNYGGVWHYRGARYTGAIVQTNDRDVDELVAVGTIVRAVPELKYTIEYSSLRIYSNDEAQLHSIATAIQEKTGRLGTYAGIWSPDKDTIDAIDSGYEILTKDPGYTHKVMLRDRFLDFEVKRQILHYLDSLDGVVKISPAVRAMLSSRGSYLYSGWFRTSDTSILSFLELICPGVVRKIIPVYVKNK